MNGITDTKENCVLAIKGLYDYALAICSVEMVMKVLKARSEDLLQNDIDWK